MAGQLVLRKQAIQRAADQVAFAKSHNYPESWIEERIGELRHQVQMFKMVCDGSRADHAKEFEQEFPINISAIDLMEMGY